MCVFMVGVWMDMCVWVCGEGMDGCVWLGLACVRGGSYRMASHVCGRVWVCVFV